MSFKIPTIPFSVIIETQSFLMNTNRPLLSQKRVKFYCRSFSLELYRLSSSLYNQAGYPCVRLTDQTADGYFCTILRDMDCDIAINVDEDAFISNLEAVLDLAEMTLQKGLVNVGCSDGGKGCVRRGVPEVTNPFFNVFNLEEIRKKWNEAELMPVFEKKRYEGVEPYYPFFRWMVAAFPDKTYYLENRKHADKISTVLTTPEGTDFLIHTWFARFYHPTLLSYLFEGNSTKTRHTERIDDVINEVYRARVLERPKFGFADQLAFGMNGIVRWCIKIPQRILNWPHKISQKLCRK